MFTQKGLLFVVFISAPACYVLKTLARIYPNLSLEVTIGWSIPVPLEFLATLSFCLCVASIGLLILSMLVLGLLPSMPGLNWTEEERPVRVEDFTVRELWEMDQEDEPHWNESHRQVASASWDGRNNPVYEDYKGYLRDAITNEVLCNNKTDQRRVVGGKVVRFGGKNVP
jgi:hypothetical protein